MRSSNRDAAGLIAEIVDKLVPKAEIEPEIGYAHLDLRGHLMWAGPAKADRSAVRNGTCVAFINQMADYKPPLATWARSA
jgi:RecA/RadA recombinase